MFDRPWNALKSSIWKKAFSLLLTLLSFVNIVINIKRGNITSLHSDEDLRWSFSRIDGAIHPFAVHHLLGSLADSSPIILSVNLFGAYRSNEMITEIKERGDGFFASEKDGEHYLYKLVGRTSSGIYCLHTVHITTGTGSFHRLLFVEFCHQDIIANFEKGEIRRALAMSAIGDFGLGDRFIGEVKLDENDTIIISGGGRHKEIPFGRFTIKIIENSKDGETT